MRKLIETIKTFNAVGLGGAYSLMKVRREVAPLIRGFVLTHVMGALQQTGVFDFLRNKPSDAPTIAKTLSLELETLEILLNYLYSVRVLARKNGNFSVAKAAHFAAFEPHGFFTLYAAYGPIFASLPDLLTGKKTYGKEVNRNETLMATGSSQIVRWLPVPSVLNWLKKYGCAIMLDLGCGTGDFLAKVRQEIGIKSLFGADRSPDIVELARRRNPGTENQKIQYFVVDAMNPEHLSRLYQRVDKVDVITIMFVLHEIAFHGSERVVALLKNLREHFPHTRLFICELGKRDIEEMRAIKHAGHDLLLYHALSHQKPLTTSQWRKVFQESGYRIEEEKLFDFMSQNYFVLNPR